MGKQGNGRMTKKQRALDAYRLTGTKTEAAAAAGVAPKTLYQWIKTSSKFAAAIEEADQAVDDRLQVEALTRAIEGKSDTMLKVMLAARMPDRFGQRSEHIIRGTIEHRHSVPELIDQLVQHVGQAKADELLATIRSADVNATPLQLVGASSTTGDDGDAH